MSSPIGTRSAAVRAPVRSTAVDAVRAAAAVRELMLAVGLDPDLPVLLRTPDRVAETFAELLAGAGEDAGEPLDGGAPNTGGPVVITLRALSFRSLCPHHLLPYAGRIDIRYLPGERIIGIGSFARTIGILASRPQLQEDLTRELADLVLERAGAIHVEVSVSARHPCMADRGPRESSSVLETSAVAARGEASP